MKVYRIWDNKYQKWYNKKIYLFRNHATCSITYAIRYKRYSINQLVVKEFELYELYNEKEIY